MILMILVCISSRLYDDMIMSRRDYMMYSRGFSSRLYETYVGSRQFSSRFMWVCVFFYGGRLTLLRSCGRMRG